MQLRTDESQPVQKNVLLPSEKFSEKQHKKNATSVSVDLKREEDGLHWIVDGNDTGRIPKGTLTIWSEVLFENIDKDYFIPHEVFKSRMTAESDDEYRRSHKTNRSNLKKYIEFDYERKEGMRLSPKYIKLK